MKPKIKKHFKEIYIYTAVDTTKLMISSGIFHTFLLSISIRQPSLDYFCAGRRVPTQRHSQHNRLKLYIQGRECKYKNYSHLNPI